MVDRIPRNLYRCRATYVTDQGRDGVAAFVLFASSLQDADTKAREHIYGDKRRRCAGKLDVTCTLVAS